MKYLYIRKTSDLGNYWKPLCILHDDDVLTVVNAMTEVGIPTFTSSKELTSNLHWGRRQITLCQADDDDYCNFDKCPQHRDGEPGKTGRHCPLDCTQEVE